MCTDGAGEAATVGVMEIFSLAAAIEEMEAGLVPLSARAFFCGLFALAFLGDVVAFVTSVSVLI